MNARAKRQQSLIDELHTMARRIDELMLLEGVFPDEDVYLDGQCNSLLVVAYQQLETVVSTIGDQGYSGVDGPNENLVLQVVERRREPRGKGGLEADAPAKAGMGRSGVARRVVVGGAR
jgi:hypothetical protein